MIGQGALGAVVERHVAVHLTVAGVEEALGHAQLGPEAVYGPSRRSEELEGQHCSILGLAIAVIALTVLFILRHDGRWQLHIVAAQETREHGVAPDAIQVRAVNVACLVHSNAFG